jgi:hypothetical protein
VNGSSINLEGGIVVVDALADRGVMDEAILKQFQMKEVGATRLEVSHLFR